MFGFKIRLNFLFNRIWLILVFVIYSFFLSAQHSTSFISFNGKVLSSHSQWNETHTNIYTYYKVKVLQEITGRLPTSEITLQQVGGRVGNIAQITNLFNKLNNGDETTFYVEKSQSGTNYTFAPLQYKKQASPLRFNSAYNQRSTLRISTLLQGIDSISPHVGYAGTQDTLFIFGKGFGITQGIGKILFSNAFVGGVVSNVEPYPYQYLEWSDTIIKVQIPSKNFAGLGSAGSGKITIITDTVGSTLVSPDSLTIPYSCLNNASGDSIYVSYLIDNNGNGGYTFSINNKIFVNDTITSTIARCMEKWQCPTQVNFSLGSSSSANSAANDGINLITGDSLSSSLLGYTSLFFQNCSEKWYAVDIDIIFNNSLSWNFGANNAGSSKFDFETLLLQSLGFAQLLQNSNDSLSVMFWEIVQGKSKKNLSPWDIAGGVYNVQKSSSANGCGPSNFIPTSPCAVGFSLDASVVSIVSPYSGFCHGAFPVTIKICNNGLISIDTLHLNWSVNGVTQAPIIFSSILNHHDTALVNIGSYSFNTAGTYQLKIWSSNPNNLLDSYPYSDTLYKSIVISACNNADAGVSGFSSPTNYLCLGNNLVSVNLTNHASTPLNVVELNWEINGVLQTPITWTGTISASSTVYGVPIGNYNFTAPSNVIKAWSSSPNGITDSNHSNDTSNVNYTPDGLNGIYTVGGTSPSYTTLTAAFNDINNKGICSDVTLNIRPGTYNGVFSLNNINSNQLKKLTIQAEDGDSSSVVITSNQITLTFVNTNWIHLQHVTVSTTGSFDAARFTDCNNLEINNCRFIGLSDSASGNTFNDLVAIAASNRSDSILIHNNLLQFGFTAIGYSGISSAYGTNICVQNNVIYNSTWGVSIGYAKRPKIMGNNLQSSSFSYGINVGSCEDGFEIVKNKLVYLGNGLYVQNCAATSSLPARVYNNSFSALNKSNHTTNGITFLNAPYLEFFYNSINIHGQSAIYINILDTTQYLSKVSLQNNIIVNTDTGVIYQLNSSSATNGQNFNLLGKNVYFINSAFPTFFLPYASSSSGSTGFRQWQTITQKDSTSIYRDPEYASLQDLHIYPDTSNTLLNGFASPVSYITDDYDSQPRNPITPDPGAYEFNLFSLDAGVKAFSQGVFCSGNNTVYASLKNYGSSTLTTVSIGWSVNGILQSASSFSSSINPQTISPFLPLGNFNFITTQTYTVKAWPVLLNDSMDQNHINDTIYGIFTANGMSGNYTIGGSTPSYTTITDARNDLVLRGVCGPVIFDISPGTYSEQVSFPPIMGTSFLNNITFRSSSGDSSSVIVSYKGTGSLQNSVIELAGVSYLNIEKISLYDSSGTTVLSIDSSSNCRISNCAFNQSSLSSIATSQTSLSEYNVFENNLINGAISIQGFTHFGGSYSGWANACAKGNKLINNVIGDAVYIYMVQDMLISQNIFNQSFQISNSNDTIQITRNKFAAGATLIECIAQSNNPFLLTNNFSYVTSGNNNPFFFQAVQYASFFYNSIRVDSAANTTDGFVAIEDANDAPCIGISFKNNSIAVYNNAEALFIGFNSFLVSSDYNNFYTNGVNVINHNGISYPSLANWQSFTGFDAHSISYSPMYTSPTDLHLLNDYHLGHKATPISSIPIDIDGQTRNITAPDIGADEYSFTMFNLNIGTFASAKPIAPNCSGDSIFISIKNYGLFPVTSFIINGQINGNSLSSYNWSGSLNSGTEIWNLYIGTYSFVLSNTYTMQIWSQDPNGGIDGYPANDTTKVIFNYVPHTASFLQPNHFCQGDSVSIASQFTYSSYNWSIGATTQNIIVNHQGWYSLIVKNSIGCIMTDSAYVTQNALPAPPVITYSVNQLISSYSTHNQWYLNGTTLIIGDTGQICVPSVLGNYSVMYTDSNGCSSTSLPFNITGISTIDGTDITFFPNPTTKYLYFTGSDASVLNQSQIVVQDMQGDIIKVAMQIKDGNSLLDFSGQPPGVYLIHLYIKNTVNTIKLVLIPD